MCDTIRGKGRVIKVERLTDDFSTACMKCAGEEMGCRPVFKSGKYSKKNADIMEKCHNREVYDRLRQYELTRLTIEEIKQLQEDLKLIGSCSVCKHNHFPCEREDNGHVKCFEWRGIPSC